MGNDFGDLVKVQSRVRERCAVEMRTRTLFRQKTNFGYFDTSTVQHIKHQQHINTFTKPNHDSSNSSHSIMLRATSTKILYQSRIIQNHSTVVATIRRSISDKILQIEDDVRQALANGKPVVALESTIVAHGMPYPENLQLAQKVGTILREKVRIAGRLLRFFETVDTRLTLLFRLLPC